MAGTFFTGSGASRIGAIVFSAALLLGASIAAAQTAPAPGAPASSGEAPYTYNYSMVFPVELPGLGFGMPKQTFLDVIATRKLTPTTNAAKTMFLVQPAGAPYSSVVYFFNSNAGEILTEMELRFADDARAKIYFDQRFPPQSRSAGDEWFYGNGVLPYNVKAWRFQSKVYIVSTMANTRWAGK